MVANVPSALGVLVQTRQTLEEQTNKETNSLRGRKLL